MCVPHMPGCTERTLLQQPVAPGLQGDDQAHWGSVLAESFLISHAAALWCSGVGCVQGTAGMSKLAPTEGTNMEDMISATIPMGRMGERSDIALTCVYLASSAASYVSGAPPHHFCCCLCCSWCYCTWLQCSTVQCSAHACCFQ